MNPLVDALCVVPDILIFALGAACGVLAMVWMVWKRHIGAGAGEPPTRILKP